MFQRRVEGEFGVWLDRMVSWGFSHIPMPSFCAPPSPLLRSDRIYAMWGGAHVVARSLPGEGRLLCLGNSGRELEGVRGWFAGCFVGFVFFGGGPAEAI